MALRQRVQTLEAGDQAWRRDFYRLASASSKRPRWSDDYGDAEGE